MSKKYIAAFVGFAVVSSLFLSVGVSHGDTNTALAYLKSKPLTAWTIMALTAAGESPALDSLKSVSSEKAIDYEAPILALTAAGKDPRTFGATDYVAKLKSFSDGTQLGDATTLNDDIFGILALLSAGEEKESASVSSTLRFVLNHQNSDGGWGYAVGGASDTNTTAAAVMALRAAGTPAPDTSITKALDYLKSAQNGDGGFPYDPKSAWGTDSDASSDAWVIMAIKSAGQDPAAWQKDSKSPLANLATFADASGFYRYQQGASEDSFSPTTTSYAVIALANKFFPLRVLAPTAPVPVHYSYRIEGKTQELCAGESDGVTALESVRAAADACGITYHIQESSIGSYVDEIATEKAAGASGWMYAVKNELPSVGAGDYKLAANDDIIWYYGAYGDELLRLTLDATSTAAGTPISGKVETYHAHAWAPFAGAAVLAGNTSTTTDVAGKFSLSLPEGIHSLSAEAANHVRSNTEKAAVGEPDATAIPLSVTIATSTGGNGPSAGSGSASGGGGGTGSVIQGISITVETGTTESGLDFGSLGGGGAQKKTITLKNKGQKKLAMQAAVSGDDVFRSYLFLDGKTWRVYHAAVEPGGTVAPETSLRIPASYPAPGAKKGALVFWAVPVE
ncbi:MAG: DUF4430 domain-containing protein [Candidatus Liptonbacteria bacterium]|nr:DUF4430 domain-containing protein [Candidatus Liptonbacteria bacterium]